VEPERPIDVSRAAIWSAVNAYADAHVRDDRAELVAREAELGRVRGSGEDGRRYVDEAIRRKLSACRARGAAARGRELELLERRDGLTPEERDELGRAARERHENEGHVEAMMRLREALSRAAE
jgi:hypothetical protein